MSRTLRVLAAAASVLLLAGCTSMFAPDPTAVPTASATPTYASVTCRPATSTFEWTDPTPVVSYEAISVASHSYGKHESGTSFDQNDPDYSFAGVESSGAMQQVLADIDRWAPVMAKSLHASTAAPADLGRIASVVNSSDFVPPKPHRGTWVRAVVAQSKLYRFTLTCQDGTTADGASFGGVDPGTATTIVLHCDDERHPEDSPTVAAARAQCTMQNAMPG